MYNINMARRKKENDKNKFIGMILTLCIIAVLTIVANIRGQSFGEFWDEIRDRFFDTSDNIERVDKDAQNLADLANNSDKLLLYVIDTGNSDCIVIRSPEGNSMIVDAADNDDSIHISAVLRSFGIENLDYAVATHPDADHIGSMDEVITEFKPKHFLMPNYIKNTATYTQMIDALYENEIDTTVVEEHNSFDLGSVYVEVLQPLHTYDDPNDSSIVLLVKFGKTEVLLTGDIEDEAIDDLLETYPHLIDVDILKVAHHGSSTSTSAEFLNATTPDIAIITCGKDNDYGHPHKETIELLEEDHIEILRTDLNGDIAITSDGTNIYYSTAA